MTHCRDCTLIEAGAESLEYSHVADAPVMTHDNFEQNVASDPATPRVLGVIGLYFVEQPGRFNPATRPIRASAGAAPFAFADARTLAFTVAGALPCPDAAVLSRPVTVRGFDRVFDLSLSIVISGSYSGDRSHDGLGRGRFRRRRRRRIWCGRLFDNRNRYIRVRRAVARNPRGRLRRTRPAAAPAAAGARRQQEYKVRLLVNGVLERCGLDPAGRQPNKKRRDQGMRRGLQSCGFKAVRMLADREGFKFIEGTKQ